MEKIQEMVLALVACGIGGDVAKLTGCEGDGVYLSADAPGTEGYVTALVQLRIFEPWNGMIRDLKEQRIRLVPRGCEDHECLEELMLGWALAVEHVLDTYECPEHLVPGDFEVPRSVFGLKRPKTADDYKAAFLVKSRFGRFLQA